VARALAEHLHEIPEVGDVGLDRRRRAEEDMFRPLGRFIQEREQVVRIPLVLTQDLLATCPVGLVDNQHPERLRHQQLAFLREVKDKACRYDRDLPRALQNPIGTHGR
jgi:hypothetical protein